MEEPGIVTQSRKEEFTPSEKLLVALWLGAAFIIGVVVPQWLYERDESLDFAALPAFIYMIWSAPSLIFSILLCRRTAKLWIWLIFAVSVQLVAYSIRPFQLRTDGSLRYVITHNGEPHSVVSGTNKLAFRMIPWPYDTFGYDIKAEDMRLNTTQINCTFFPVRVEGARFGCETNLWSIEVDVPVTDAAFRHIRENMQQVDFVTYVNAHVCWALESNPTTYGFHTQRVDVLHDEAAKQTISETVVDALKQRGLESRTPPTISAVMTAQPPQDTCNK